MFREISAVSSDVDQSTSHTLLDRARSGDHEAWDLMVRIYTPLIFRRCRALNLSREDSGDVVQDVFLKMWTKLKTFEVRADGGFRNWLQTITRHAVTDWFRTRPGELEAVGGSEAMLRCLNLPAVLTEDSLLSSSGPGESQAALREALSRIQSEFSTRDWQAFCRVRIEGQAPRDVAQELAMTYGSVRTAVYRVQRRLKMLIGDLDGPEEGPGDPAE